MRTRGWGVPSGYDFNVDGGTAIPRFDCVVEACVGLERDAQFRGVSAVGGNSGNSRHRGLEQKLEIEIEIHDLLELELVGIANQGDVRLKIQRDII